MITAELIDLATQLRSAARVVAARSVQDGRRMNNRDNPPDQSYRAELRPPEPRVVPGETSCAAYEERIELVDERRTVTTKTDEPKYRRWLDVAPPSDYLRNIANSATGKGYKAFAKSLLQIEEGAVVVDLGCGAGVDLPAYARAAGDTGTVIGIDNDEALLAHAEKSATRWPTVSVTQADIHQLPLDAESVDRIHIDRVLQHVESPPAVLAEAARTLRTDGRIVCVEPDWATLVFDHPDVAFSDTYTQHVVAQVIRNATMGRALPRLLDDAGLSVETIYPVTAHWTDAIEADKVLGFRDVCKHAVTDGHLPAARTQGWIDDLMTGPFFCSLSLFIVSARIKSRPMSHTT
ncbi:MAG: methyltransferase domain-containing protein [Chlorobi bacterium CHB2]|jgi:ubiquinone/menaquinone biosynthesis C-methylase UbiE|uniref:methyltransferase domain-containing protein n=1 Tax=Mycolicibacterium conceptionense TaxID=451644 RepID=UPI0009B931AD|nr:methyltransferase domain-containing protein [Mycolicibacterium conceptionense]MCE7933579.1 methyltransferase domain-containing protein [Chlorobi bacterium CHB2]